MRRHEHGTGDRCLSFHFAADHFEDVVAAVPGSAPPRFPGAAHFAFVIARAPDRAAAETAADDVLELEEVGLRLAGAVAASLARSGKPPRSLSRRDERRISDAVRRIEAEAGGPITLAALADGAGFNDLSTFNRRFRRMTGLTPTAFRHRQWPDLPR